MKDFQPNVEPTANDLILVSSNKNGHVGHDGYNCCLLQDMLISLSTLLHGTLKEKLVWTFRVYDLNGDGVITKNEMGNVVVAVYELMGISLLPPVSPL